MTSTPLAYQSLLTVRSRRLRTIGSLLLIAVLGMTLYGYFGLMPSLRATLPTSTKQSASLPASPSTALTNARTNGITARTATPAAPIARMSRQERDAEATKLIFAYGYWGVCLVLLIALMLVAWLDFRELSRSYEQQRLAVFNATLQAEPHSE